jgi:hypothetical protein
VPPSARESQSECVSGAAESARRTVVGLASEHSPGQTKREEGVHLACVHAARAGQRLRECLSDGHHGKLCAQRRCARRARAQSTAHAPKVRTLRRLCAPSTVEAQRLRCLCNLRLHSRLHSTSRRSIHLPVTFRRPSDAIA